MPRYRSCRTPSPAVYIGWIVAAIVVIALVYLGCSTLNSKPSSSRPSTTYSAPTKPTSCVAAKRSSTLAGDNTVLQSGEQPQDVEVAFNELQNYTMTRVNGGADARPGAGGACGAHDEALDKVSVKSEMFMNLNVDEAHQREQFKPVSKDKAKRGAVTRANQTMVSSRDDGAKMRTVGMDVLAFARPMRHTPLPLGKCAFPWGDSDTRQFLYNRATNCMASQNCPWDTDCGETVASA